MNEKIFYFFYNFTHSNEVIHETVIFVAQTLPWLVMVAAFLFLLNHHDVLRDPQPVSAFSRKWREIIYVFLVSVGAWFISHILKNIIQVERPFNALPEIQNLISESGYAFPSGHATTFMALAVSIYLLHRRGGVVFIALAVLIGIARIAVGVHYPFDILGGLVLGTIIAYLFKTNLLKGGLHI